MDNGYFLQKLGRIDLATKILWRLADNWGIRSQTGRTVGVVSMIYTGFTATNNLGMKECPRATLLGMQ